MELLFDADALIKLNRAGILRRVAEVFDCAMPHEVFEEVVVKGGEYAHSDAEEIERVIASDMVVRPPVAISEEYPRLDTGERAVLALASQGENRVIVSDDRQFVNFLSRAGIPHLVPAALIIVMAQQQILTTDEAREHLNRLRPLIRTDSYMEALQELEKLEA